MADSLSELTRDIMQFRDEREWGQFHTPRQLAAALAIEAAELQEVLLWKSDEEVRDLVGTRQGVERLAHEIADVLIFGLLMANAVGIDPAAAVKEKLLENATKYPVSRSKGRATKYTDL